ncbi:hypothetical protein TNCV_3991251 [Trichonephila clavipes]|uniref:Uncharacterized protein n=1 Tax=Trichonephila clavipes TaxID=2585209 RepID=A0A8X6T624_TRICX|nr:hypothetical protein TNCV_3991251 [Trichonephila clavipes]
MEPNTVSRREVKANCKNPHYAHTGWAHRSQPLWSRGCHLGFHITREQALLGAIKELGRTEFGKKHSDMKLVPEKISSKVNSLIDMLKTP